MRKASAINVKHFICFIRSRTAEGIIREYFFSKCTRSESGCTFEGPRDVVEDHEKKACSLRTYKCPWVSCGTDVAVRDFGDHMKASHGTQATAVVKGGSFDDPFYIRREDLETPGSWPFLPRTLENLGTFFAYLDFRDGLFHLWVYSVGDQDMAESFRVEMTLSGT